MTTVEGVLGLRERFIENEELTDYGTAQSLTGAAIPGSNVTINPGFTQGFQEVLNNGTDDRKVIKRVPGPLSLPYTLSYYPTTWRRLKYLLDIDSESDADPIFTHNLSIGNTIKSYTAEWALRHDTAPIIIKMTGNVINKYTINFQKSTGEGNDGFVQVVEDCFAQNYTTPSIQGGTFAVTGDPFQYRHIKWTLEGSEVVEINNGSIKFDQGMTLNDSRYANSTLGRTIGSPIPQTFRISGRMNVNLLDTTYIDLWELAAAMSSTNTLVFEETALSNTITFTFTDLYVEPVPLSETNVDGINTADFVFTAMSVAVVCKDGIENW